MEEWIRSRVDTTPLDLRGHIGRCHSTLTGFASTMMTQPHRCMYDVLVQVSLGLPTGIDAQIPYYSL